MSSLKDWLARLSAPLLLFATAVLVRALPWPTVITEKTGIQPFGNDAHYHLRRIQYAALNPGEFLSRDSYVNFPHGGTPIWPPAFDWTLAQLVRFTTGAGDQAAMELLLVWVPPVLGACTVVALYWIARRHFSSTVALGASSLLCILPANFWYSQIGFIDHHVAVALLTTLLLGVGMSLIDEEPDTGPLSTQVLRRPALLGVMMGLVLLLWPGALLHVAVVQLCFGIRALSCRSRESAAAWVRMLALAHAIACLTVLPWSAGNKWEVWGEFSPVVLSNFQPMWFAACAAGFALLSSLWARKIVSETAIDRSLAALALAGAGLGVALLVLPELSAGVLQSWDWFSKDEAFQASVAESAPLFRAPARRVQELFSRLVYVTPLAIGLLVWEKARSARPAFWLLLCWASVLFAATLTQRRFMNSASVVYSLTMALALSVAFQRIALLGRQTPLLRAAATVAFAAVLGWALLPVFASYGLDLVNLQRSARGETLQLARIKRVLLLKTAAAYWLQRVSPSTSGYFDQSVEPEYSVLTPWSDGHVFRYRARRPVNQDNFGNDVGSQNFELAERYYSSPNEAEAVAILEQMGARYVVASAIEVRRTGGYGLRSMFARLSLPEGGPKRELGRGDEARRLAVTRLVHHRLIYETAPLEGAPGDGRSYYKLYELVPGARVSGSAPAGTLLEARLSLFPALGGELLFVTAAQTDASGRYSLTVPYPNARFSEGVRSGEFYSLNSPAGSARFTVSERAVRSGEAVEGPSLAQ